MARFTRALPFALVVLACGALLAESAPQPAIQELGDTSLAEETKGKDVTSAQENPTAVPEESASEKHLQLAPDIAMPKQAEKPFLKNKMVCNALCA